MRALTGARLFTGEAMLDGFSLIIDGDRIADLVPDAEFRPGAELVRCPQGSTLAPGFIDAQANGAGGVLFNDEPTEAAVLTIARALRRSGGTGLLPTLITDDRAKMAQAAEAVIAASRIPGSGILGIHFEGPFISPNRPGVHNPQYIRPLDEEDIAFLTGLPERMPQGKVLLTYRTGGVEDSVIARLAEAGIVISAGHLVAGSSAMRRGRAWAARTAQTFNAMPPINSHKPAVTTAAARPPQDWSRNHHARHPYPSGGVEDGDGGQETGPVFPGHRPCPRSERRRRFELYGQRILRRDGRLVTEDGTLAGADIDMASAVRNCVHMLGLPLEKALAMASLHPANCCAR